MLAGIALLICWGAWWSQNFKADRLKFAEHTWVPTLPPLGSDFRVHTDHVARLWASGRDPYLNPCDWVCSLMPYPPLIPRLFGWVTFFEPKRAAHVWIVALAAIVVASGIAASIVRKRCGIEQIPWPALAAIFAFSTPFLSAMERGQVDPLVLPVLFLSGWLLSSNARGGEGAAGALLGAFTWFKFYPAVTLIGLLAMRRWRALGVFVVVALAIGFVDLQRLRPAISAGIFHAYAKQDPRLHTTPTQHAIGKFWPELWRNSPWPTVGNIPGPVMSLLLMGPIVLWVTTRFFRARAGGALAVPLLLWLTAAGTFALPYSNDYNLVFLPVAALAVWSERDRLIIQFALLLCLPWCQPFAVPIGGIPLFLSKLGGLYAVGACLEARAREASDYASTTTLRVGARAVRPPRLPSAPHTVRSSPTILENEVFA
jgi:hypothetical protein